jgi:hypothetical protein
MNQPTTSAGKWPPSAILIVTALALGCAFNAVRADSAFRRLDTERVDFAQSQTDLESTQAILDGVDLEPGQSLEATSLGIIAFVDHQPVMEGGKVRLFHSIVDATNSLNSISEQREGVLSR